MVFENDPLKWKQSKCSCKKNKKSFMCIHVIAAAIDLDILEADDGNVPIQANRSRGRPKKVPKGLAKE